LTSLAVWSTIDNAGLRL